MQVQKYKHLYMLEINKYQLYTKQSLIIYYGRINTLFPKELFLFMSKPLIRTVLFNFTKVVYLAVFL